MHIVLEPKRSAYLGNHAFQSLFSFPIADHIQVQVFERGEFILKEGSYPEYLYYMVEGKAKIYLTHANGKVSLIHFIQPGTFIGEMELLNEAYYTKGIQTSAKTVCFAVPVHACKEQLLNDPAFLKHLCISLSKKEMVMAAKYTQSLAYPLENRLAEFLLLSADDDFYKEKHTEICEYLGVSYRHLLHVFAQFIEAGYIEKQGRGFLIKNKEALQELATTIYAK
ncbi:transcriptional regulator YeiL [Bacillus sp. AGMB 02131]|uniref:Transcriptional regulator YeiL n=1 Tax=Peribacillus faecalis TaxID=2772559 RepID=A0A927HBH8_9BACI|nr:transcriptional regulator YeiL [Peribacillus faecalis]MBD3109760.1 transcriptional regulator YeiL [Peribacillus faecalis]